MVIKLNQCVSYKFFATLLLAAYSLRWEGIFTRSIIKTPVSPSQSGSVSTVTLVSPCPCPDPGLSLAQSPFTRFYPRPNL